jgi:hypothetical protein
MDEFHYVCEPHPRATGPHTLPLGALVEVDVDHYNTRTCGSEVHLKGKCKLVVVGHGWDCDGTPLYQLADLPVKFPLGGAFKQPSLVYRAVADYVTSGGGYSDRSLKDTGARVKMYEDVRTYLLGDD